MKPIYAQIVENTLNFIQKLKIKINMDIVDYGNPAYEDDKEFECTECGSPVETEGSVCSRDCFNASML
jgi:hypothetical protein